MESRTESGSENVLETSSVTASRAASFAVEAENTESIKCMYECTLPADSVDNFLITVLLFSMQQRVYHVIRM